jgi:hypothetical protein
MRRPSFPLRSHALWSPSFVTFAEDGHTILPPPGKHETACCNGSRYARKASCGFRPGMPRLQLAGERYQHCDFGQARNGIPVFAAIITRVPAL